MTDILLAVVLFLLAVLFLFVIGALSVALIVFAGKSFEALRQRVSENEA